MLKPELHPCVELVVAVGKFRFPPCHDNKLELSISVYIPTYFSFLPIDSMRWKSRLMSEGKNRIFFFVSHRTYHDEDKNINRIWFWSVHFHTHSKLYTSWSVGHHSSVQFNYCLSLKSPARYGRMPFMAALFESFSWASVRLARVGTWWKTQVPNIIISITPIITY